MHTLFRSRRSSTARKSSSPPPKPQQPHRLKQMSAEKNLRLHLPKEDLGGGGGDTPSPLSPTHSAAHSPREDQHRRSRAARVSSVASVKTTSEVSELPLATPSPSPRSPRVDFFREVSLHDIEELEEIEEELAADKEEAKEAKVEDESARTEHEQPKPMVKEQAPQEAPVKPEKDDVIELRSSSSSSTSTIKPKTPSDERREERKSRRRRRKSRRRRSPSSEGACPQCARLCSFHRRKLQEQPEVEHERVRDRHDQERRSASAQIGDGRLRSEDLGHYLFDPTVEAASANIWRESANVAAASMRQPLET